MEIRSYLPNGPQWEHGHCEAGESSIPPPRSGPQWGKGRSPEYGNHHYGSNVVIGTANRPTGLTFSQPDPNFTMRQGIGRTNNNRLFKPRDHRTHNLGFEQGPELVDGPKRPNWEWEQTRAREFWPNSVWGKEPNLGDFDVEEELYRG